MSTFPNPAHTTFPDSQTCRSLRTACLGEMHARRFYLQAARQMEDASLHVIAHAFSFTAAQEKEHADVFRGLIAAHGGPAVPMAEDAPVLLPHTPLELLQAVAKSEQDEGDMLYPHYARIAAQEEYPRIAEAFRRVAETEHLHARRFRQYAAALSGGTLFKDSRCISWVCLACGQLHSGHEAPGCCSSCGRDRGCFIRSNFYPFIIED